jgi:hypothetical protein
LRNQPESEGAWEYSLIFLENKVAQFYGLAPSQFRALSWQDRTEMVAFMKDSEIMRGYEDYLSTKKINKGRNK